MKNPNTKQLAHILKNLQVTHALYQKLQKLLLSQQKFFVEFKSQELQENAKTQIKVLNDLSKLRENRAKLLTSLKLDNSNDGIRCLFKFYPQSLQEKIETLWSAICQLNKISKKLNLQNGKLSAHYHEILSDILNNQNYDPMSLMKY